MGKKNGYFQLAEDEKGTCLKVFPPEDGGSRVVVEDVMKYCKAIKLADYNLGGLEAYLQGWDTLAEPFHLTSFRVPTQDEVVLVEADSRGEEAYGRFYPPTEGGALLDKDEIVQALVAGKVVFGLQEDLLEEFLYNREYCKDILLAKAMPPEDGKDAEVTYHFNTSQVSKPKLGEDGSVDFHSLDNIQGVKKGDLLVTLTPADPGKPGMTVFGKVVKPKNVTRKVLKQGNNYTVSEDGLTIHSDVSGHVALVNGDIVVSDIYTVPEDVGFSTGDIAYDGNVEVRGNVLSGFVVKASGSIIVDGVVEGATLRAGAEIILKRGIQGMSKGILEADGNIITKFIENSEVVSGGDIITDAIMHSQVTARGRVTVVGKRGRQGDGGFRHIRQKSRFQYGDGDHSGDWGGPRGDGAL